jgi:hypothetical protein
LRSLGGVAAGGLCPFLWRAQRATFCGGAERVDGDENGGSHTFADFHTRARYGDSVAHVYANTNTIGDAYGHRDAQSDSFCDVYGHRHAPSDPF